MSISWRGLYLFGVTRSVMALPPSRPGFTNNELEHRLLLAADTLGVSSLAAVRKIRWRRFEV